MKASLRTLKKLSWALAAGSLLSVSAFADVGGVPQASINLDGSAMHYCNTVNNTWTLSKSADVSSVEVGGQVTWTIEATKNGATVGGDPVTVPAQFCVEGVLVITNTGAADATVGNIVVNLQRQRNISGKQRWVSVGADVSTATQPQLATNANLLANVTSESASWQGSWYGAHPTAGFPNYTVSGSVGNFKESAGYSGDLIFTDDDGNDITASVNYTVGPGQTVNMNYKATFTSAAVGDASHLRTEVLVTFGNAGGRGGSGASIDNVDIDMDGVTNCPGDECHVRTVPVRASLNVPQVIECNESVTLEDTLSTLDDVTWESAGGTFAGTPTPTDSASYTLITTVTGGSNGSQLTNTVTMTGNHSAVDNDECCTTASDSKSVTITVTNNACTPNDPRPECGQLNCPCGESETFPGRCNVCSGDFCSYTKGGYQGGGVPGQLVNNNFATVFSGGMTIGNYTPSDGRPYGAKWDFDQDDALQSALTGGGPNTPTHMTADSHNATSVSGGNLAQQTMALTLSVAFSNANVLAPGFGSLEVCVNWSDLNSTTCDEVITIQAILDLANLALSYADDTAYDYSTLNQLVTNLNESFDNCNTATGWAQSHIKMTQ